MNIIYHYYPQFRRAIFETLERRAKVRFIYGRNGRFGVKTHLESRHDVRRNVFWQNLIVQTTGLSTLRAVCTDDSIILGDIKFVNSWLYAILGRLCGRRIWFWTHGVLEFEVGWKWMLRKLYYNLADGLLLYSENEVGLMKALGYKKPIKMIGNTNFSHAESELLETHIKTIAQASQLSPTAQDGVCYIGRISPEKGFRYYKKLAEILPDRPVILIGPALSGYSVIGDQPENLSILPPEYEPARLVEVTRNCRNFIMFTPGGLALFTATLLGKRVIVRAQSPQKPEYHLLKKYDLIDTFESFDELVALIDSPRLSDSEWVRARRAFLNENNAENVVARILAAAPFSETDREAVL